MNIDYKNCSCGQMATQCKALLSAQAELLLKKTDTELKNKEIEKYKTAMEEIKNLKTTTPSGKEINKKDRDIYDYTDAWVSCQHIAQKALKDFWQKLEIEPKTTFGCKKCSFPDRGTCKECKFSKELYPDILSDTPQASYNRELLENCIINWCKTGFSVIKENDLQEIAMVTGGTGFNFKSANGKNRTEALKLICEKVAYEIRDEVAKIKGKLIYSLEITI